MEQPNFLKYLRYFLFGPDRPEASIERFRKILIDDTGTSGMILEALCSCARAEARRLGRYDAAEEFFKLALEGTAGDETEVINGKQNCVKNGLVGVVERTIDETSLLRRGTDTRHSAVRRSRMTVETAFSIALLPRLLLRGGVWTSAIRRSAG